jgi:hypothetical protein
MPAKGTHTPRAPISDPRDTHGWHALTESFAIQKLKQVHAATHPARLERKLSKDGEEG